MMHFAATGTSFLALIFAAVGAFTTFIETTNKKEGKYFMRYDAKGQCVNFGVEICQTWEEAKKSADEDPNSNWEGSVGQQLQLAGTFALMAFIFSIIVFLIVAAATGAKVAPALDAAKRKLIFQISAGVGGLAALMSLIGWFLIVDVYTASGSASCGGKDCSMADSAKENADGDTFVGPNLAEGFAFQILAFITLIATAALAGVAGSQEEEGEEAGKPTAPADAVAV